MRKYLLPIIVLMFILLAPFSSEAESGNLGNAIEKLASEDSGDVVAGIELLGESGTPEALSILTALEARQLMVDSAGEVSLLRDDGFYFELLTNVTIEPKLPLREVSQNNRVRRSLGRALSRARLTARDVELRREATQELASGPPDESIVDLFHDLLKTEKDREVRDSLKLALAKVELLDEDPAVRISSARVIAESDDMTMESRLRDLVQKGADGSYPEKDPKVRAEFKLALSAILGRVQLINTISNTIYGLSLGSVLVLAALGLAITFGLMRVINMAHGEMLMLGAYSTFFVREQLLAVGPEVAEWYLVFAIPFAFLTTFLVGMGLERLVIRHLYGRPLETLLSTWGLSLILIQIVRVTFGAQNVTVANPEWLSGGWELMPALVVPYSRIFVLAFTAFVVLFVAYILRGTAVGLKVRAVTQNREIASSLGIPTHRIDMYTFGLGSGLAGLGGVALSQLGNVGPELGQQHIIDSFMVVVLGGVGNILGTIVAGVGLGVANKILEPSVGAVLGKIVLLGVLILFIQWRPQGLFALKGRSAGE